MEEKEAIEKLGVPFFGMNLGVGLSLPIPGFRSSVAAGLLGSLPFGASSMVGVTSMDEALKASLPSSLLQSTSSFVTSLFSVGFVIQLRF